MGLASGGADGAGQGSPDNLLKPDSRRAPDRRTRAWPGILAVTGLLTSIGLQATVAGQTPHRDVVHGYNLAATVLTLEPGIVGIQHFYHFTPTVLQGYFCAAPNTCRPVDYQTLPGDKFNELGADRLVSAVKALPADGGPVTLLGYSQGAQVIYSTLRRWQADPATAPDPSRVSWVSVGNPDNPIGGIRTKLGTSQPRPTETPYAGTEVIRQYDGWADWPDNPTNLLAVANAIVGMQTVHTKYFDVNVNDPANVRYTPNLTDGSPGNVTYVYVPNPVLPLVAGFGPLAPTLDSLLRPIVEKAYTRPVTIPAPGSQSASTVRHGTLAAAARPKPAAVGSAPAATARTIRATSARAQRHRAEHPGAAAAAQRPKSAAGSKPSRRSQ